MKYRMLILKLITATVILYACTKNKLNEPALGLVDETTLANKNGVEGLLIGAYALLDGVAGDGQGFYSVGFWGSAASNWTYGSICGSEAYTGSDIQDGGGQQINLFAKFTLTPEGDGGDFLDGKWKAVYAGIGRANAVLRVMRLAKDLSPNDTIQLHAEAVFLRAFYHFEAVKIWNKVPFVDETITYGAGNYYPNNDTLIWPAIENDFKYGVDHLPENQSPTIGRANKWAAMAFLAKAYMFEGKYSDARPLLEKLISSGVTAGGKPYALERYKDNFDPEGKNGSEAVFSVQTSVNDGGSGANGNFGDVLNYPFLGGPGGCCGFFQPSQWFVNHFKTDTATGLPDLDHFNDSVVKNDEGYVSDSVFAPYTGTLDPRLDWTVGRRGVPYLDWGPHPGQSWIRQQDYMGPYSPKKNVYKRSQEGTYSNIDGHPWALGLAANNINLIRFADILLWAAEVEAVTGDPNKARDYVNRVRQRAADSSGWVKNDDNIPFAKRVTNSPADFDSINVPSFTDIQPFDWVVREDLNQTWVLLSIKSDGTKVWNAYDPPKYKIDLYTNSWDRDYALKAIRFERVLELGMEGHRFFDLVRWNIAYDEINTYFEKEKTRRYFLKEPTPATFVKGKNEYFPIPRDQINLSIDKNGTQHLKQNPGYN